MKEYECTEKEIDNLLDALKDFGFFKLFAIWLILLSIFIVTSLVILSIVAGIFVVFPILLIISIPFRVYEWLCVAK